MKQKSIILSASEVRAVLDGHMTQFRRVVKPQPPAGVALVIPGGKPVFLEWEPPRAPYADAAPMHQQPKPPFAVGDTLWVRETFADVNSECGPGFAYRADGAFRQPDYDGPDYGTGPSFDYDKYPNGSFTMWYSDLLNGCDGHSWKPSIHMPRWASRITLAVDDVWVERARDISDEDALASGCWRGKDQYFHSTLHPTKGTYQCWVSAKQAFEMLWKQRHGPESWDHDWVWVGKFRRVEP